MTRLTTAVLIVLISAPFALASPSDDIRGYCAGIHRSYEYRLICERQEKAAKDRLYRSVGLPYGIPTEIWEYCAGSTPAGSTSRFARGGN
jgi:hypothetical protein